MKKTRPAIKCHGGKSYLSEWLISHFPENYAELSYVEPFCGGANVFFNKIKSKIEVLNDIDTSVIQIYQALRDEPKELIKRLNLLEYNEETFLKALNKVEFEDYLDSAINEYVLRRMSRGGLRKSFAWSNRLRGGKPGDVNAWETALALLPNLSKRLKEVYIFNKNAIEVIQTFNNPSVLLYCDPPYLHETRTAKTVYASEMTTDNHIELAHVLNAFAGKAMISGYASPLYARLYKNWNLTKKKIANHSAQTAKKEQKTECCWINF